MRIVRPVTITDTEFVSSDIPEPDTGETLWSAATTYAIGDKALVTDATLPADDHWIYISLKASNLNNKPEDNQTGDDPWWAKYQRSNRWRLWDDRSKSSSSNSDDFTVIVEPGVVINSIVLLNISATAVILEMTVTGLGTVYYENVNMVDTTDVIDFYPWFFEPLAFKENLIFTDLPAYSNARVTLSIYNSGSTAKLGEFIMGDMRELGASQYPYSGSVGNYNRKTRDDLTFATIEQREFVNTKSYNFLAPTSRTYGVIQQIGDFVETPAVFIGFLDHDEITEPLWDTIVFGFVKSYNYNTTDGSNTQHSLKVEELV